MKNLLLGLCLASLALPALADAPAAAAPARVAAEALEQRLGDAQLVVLDVRSPEEFAAGHVPGAINVPHDQVGSRLAELAGAKYKDVVLYCRSGRRAQLAADVLAEAGFERLSLLEGDFPGWAAQGLPTEVQAPAATSSAAAAP